MAGIFSFIGWTAVLIGVVIWLVYQALTGSRRGVQLKKSDRDVDEVSSIARRRHEQAFGPSAGTLKK